MVWDFHHLASGEEVSGPREVGKRVVTSDVPKGSGEDVVKTYKVSALTARLGLLEELATCLRHPQASLPPPKNEGNCLPIAKAR